MTQFLLTRTFKHVSRTWIVCLLHHDIMSTMTDEFVKAF